MEGQLEDGHEQQHHPDVCGDVCIRIDRLVDLVEARQDLPTRDARASLQRALLGAREAKWTPLGIGRRVAKLGALVGLRVDEDSLVDGLVQITVRDDVEEGAERVTSSTRIWFASLRRAYLECRSKLRLRRLMAIFGTK